MFIASRDRISVLRRKTSSKWISKNLQLRRPTWIDPTPRSRLQTRKHSSSTRTYQTCIFYWVILWKAAIITTAHGLTICWRLCPLPYLTWIAITRLNIKYLKNFLFFLFKLFLCVKNNDGIHLFNLNNWIQEKNLFYHVR